MKSKSARRWLSAEAQPKAYDYVLPIDGRDPRPVIVLARVSTQKQAAHLKWQEDFLRQELTRLGFIVWNVYREIAQAGPDGGDRIETKRAAQEAKDLGIELAAMSTCRFIRGPGDEVPRLEDFQRLQQLTDGAALRTVLDPALGPQAVRGIQTQLGLDARLQPGDLARRKEDKMPEARRLRNLRLSYRKIADRLNVPATVIFMWLKPA